MLWMMRMLLGLKTGVTAVPGADGGTEVESKGEIVHCY